MESKGKVVFLPTKHFPSYVKMVELEKQQDALRMYYAEVQNQAKTKYEIALRKQRIHNTLRESILIVND